MEAHCSCPVTGIRETQRPAPGRPSCRDAVQRGTQRTLTWRIVRVARLTFPEAPGPGARQGGWPAHLRSPLSARGGSSRDTGNKEVEAEARARIPGAGGAPAPRPRPATHGAESRQSLSLSRSLRVATGGVLEGGCGSTGSLRRLFTDACREPRGSSPGEPEKDCRDTGVAAAPVAGR